MEKFDVKNVSFEKTVDIYDHIISNMKLKQQGLIKVGYLLGGDPGVGKTSFIKDMARVMGMKLVTIEAPHLVEEHIINIPFIVFDPITNAQNTSNLKIDTEANFEVKLAKSNLYAQISHATKVPDAALLKSVHDGSRDDLAKLWNEMGGSTHEIPADLKQVRQKYDCILFLDEYFRQTSTSIRNMLRSILDGKIGTHDIPENVYVIYASNLNDEGVEGIPLNNDFRLLDFDVPDRDEWFTYLIGKFAKDKKVKLHDGLIDKFYTLMKKHKLSHSDLDADVRTSPRRWEQLLLYINAALPAKNMDDATHLMTNVKHNFRNYLSGDHAKMAEEVMKVVAELIKETSHLEVNAKATAPNHEWRDTLKHQIEQKMKLGHHRKYIPVISGLPGSGKTTHMTKLAIELNLIPIYIRVDNLQPEDVIGVPLSKGHKDEIEIKFSKPPLHDDIMRQAKQGELHYEERLKKHLSAADAKESLEKHKASEYKYLIFFDELNRTSTKVFNAIRRIMLEKSFGDNLDLPTGSIIVAAINPSDRGTTELTHHLRDVMDIIPAGISWAKFRKVLEHMKIETREESSVPTIMGILERFIEKFRVKGDAHHKEADSHFFLNVGTSPVYVSPREYTDLFASTVDMFDKKVVIEMKHFKNADTAEIEEIEKRLRKVIFSSFAHTLKFNFKKHDVDAPEFLATLEEWFMSSPDVSVGEVFTKTTAALDFRTIVDEYFKEPKKHLYDEPEFINYLNTVEPQRFSEDILEYLTTELKADMNREHQFLLKKDHPKKTLEKDKIKFEKEEVTKVEHFVRELIHAVKIHKLGNEMLTPVQKAVRDTLTKIKDDTQINGFLELNGRITLFVKALPT